MMLFPLAPAPLAAFKPDFVTVEQIAGRFREEGVEVQAAEDCRDDVYLLASGGLTVEGLRAALLADGRLELVKSGTGMSIRRSGTSAERATYLRYDSAVRETMVPIYSRAVSETLAIRRADPERQEKYLDIYRFVRDPDPLMKASNNLIRLINVDNDVHLSNATVPLLLMGTRAPALGRLTILRGAEAASVMEGGDLSRAMQFLRMGTPDDTPEEMERKAAVLRLDARMAWDPFSATMSAVVTLNHGQTRGGRAELVFPVAPRWVKPTAIMSQVLTAEEERAYSRRVAESGGAFTGYVHKDAEAGSGTRRLSEVLLAWARARKGASVMAYVSPFTDLRVSGAGDPAGALGQINRNAYQEAGTKDYLQAIVGKGWVEGRGSCLKLPAKFTASLAGGLLVVRNELAFLDTGGAFVPPPAFLAARAKKEPVTLEMAARSACQMRFGHHFSGSYPVQWADVGNPLAFRPFARALLDDPKLMEKVNEMGDGPLRMRATELPLGSVLQGMRDVAPYATRTGALPATEAPVTFVSTRTKEEFVVERRGAGTIAFRIGSAEAPVWSCELSNIRLSGD